ncbi:ninjurin-2 isoform X3 [Aethina tumida]|uniref:ninjurin-2 isoform X3 n=1 Tax=Aethina tumida TaxID=116153 RepID=UPI00096B2DC3|nr:ninjurin-2 isoform X3 [Aethina tumida]
MADAEKNTDQKSLDVNKYATKKTIAQGLLDVALLTANASQLKYVLQVGEKHEFYTLMLTLISISIILQIIICCLCVMLGSWLNINKDSHCPRADQFNDVLLCLNVVLVAINVLISSFDMRNSSDTGNVVTNLISNLGNIPGVGGGGGRAAVGVTPAPNATLL